MYKQVVKAAQPPKPKPPPPRPPRPPAEPPRPVPLRWDQTGDVIFAVLVAKEGPQRVPDVGGPHAI